VTTFPESPVGILSIQSRVVYGYVGHSAAVFLLQRLGFEVWPIDTVCLSNHPGYPTVRGRTVPAAEVRALLEGVEQRGALARCEAVLSGYLGEAATADVVSRAVARVKAARPGALFCCDPVMGDAGKPLYVASDLPARFRERLVPAADIVTPNAVELAHLTGQPVATVADARAAAEAVRRRGPSVVVVTGLPEADGRVLATLALGDGGAWLARSRCRDRPAHGAGDAFTAVFLGAYLRGRDVPGALARAVGALEAILDASEGGDSPDLAIVAAGDRVALGPEAPVERLP
jgi:pyridoxine kinase